MPQLSPTLSLLRSIGCPKKEGESAEGDKGFFWKPGSWVPVPPLPLLAYDFEQSHVPSLNFRILLGGQTT